VDINSKQITRVKISDAIIQPDGECEIYRNKWWVVTKNKEILFHRNFAPQCNDNVIVTTKVRDMLYKDCDIVKIDAVYFKM